MKIIPMNNSKKIVVLEEIEIFLNAKVGILLTNIIATITVK